ncbi:MAG: PEP-CTERM sorting domain-containing protein [Phycisphaerae bacterium]|nr:PEP-CTERM sorting domain-containing protein [Tepidisphaeraceae bacterium]
MTFTKRVVTGAVAAVCAWGVAGRADAAVLATYTFDAGAPNQYVASNVNPFLTATEFATTDAFGTSGATRNIDPGAGKAGGNALKPQGVTVGTSGTNATAVTQNEFLSIVVSPAAGETLNLDTLTVDVKNPGGSTRGYFFRTSLDNFATDLAPGFLEITGTSSYPASPTTFTFAGATNLTSDVTIRLYSYAKSSSTAEGLDFDNVTINGTVTPEPGTMALAGFAAAGLLGRRRRA